MSMPAPLNEHILRGGSRHSHSPGAYSSSFIRCLLILIYLCREFSKAYMVITLTPPPVIAPPYTKHPPWPLGSAIFGWSAPWIFLYTESLGRSNHELHTSEGLARSGIAGLSASHPLVALIHDLREPCFFWRIESSSKYPQLAQVCETGPRTRPEGQDPFRIRHCAPPISGEYLPDHARLKVPSSVAVRNSSYAESVSLMSHLEHDSLSRVFGFLKIRHTGLGAVGR